MPRIPIVMPQLGESIAEATIVHLPFTVGDLIEADQDCMEVETNKATMGVAVPCRGKLVELSVEKGQSYPVGSILGYLDASAEDAERCGLEVTPEEPDEIHGEPPRQTNTASIAHTPAEPASVSPTVRGLPVPAHSAGANYISPRMKARMMELGFRSSDLAGIPGSGAAGRVTIEDLEAFLSRLDQHRQSEASSMRIAVADAMLRSWSRPLATVGMRLAMEKMLAHRKACDPKPGPALYAMRALAVALGENSAPAGRLIGDKIVHPKAIDIGFAIEAEDGVLVAVLRGADQTPLREMVGRYNELVDLARRRRLPASSQGGGIATVTNFGTFGLEWATPIPLPEQTLVLGLGAGHVEPVWNAATKTFEPATQAQITLSFDHRVLDGGAAGRLLTRVSTLLQAPETL